MKKLFLIILLFAGIIVPQNDNPEITSQEIYDHIKYLSSDELEGRFTGSEKLKKAAEYLENEFKSYGLTPLFNGSYFQEYPFIEKLRVASDNQLQFLNVSKDNHRIDLTIKQDYIPLAFTDNLKSEAVIVFAGYGISSNELNYDDYKDLDVTGKIVLVFRNHPDTDNPHSKFEQFSSLRYKTTNARDKGAIGIIFINTKDKKVDELMELRYDNASKISGISAVQIKRIIADEILSESGYNVLDLQNKIDTTKSTNSFKLKNVTVNLSTDVVEVKGTSWNVGAYIDGNDKHLTNEYVVLGAHFDHLGWGEQNSLYTGEPMIHNGADDNASGTTGLLELAEKFGSISDQLKRKVIFIAFSGEELGLLGSSFVANNFPLPIENVTTMINMDMIGRLNDKNDLIVYGTGTSSNWKSILDDKNDYDFNLTFNDEGFGPSDHSSFYGKNIPVLFFFTGTHSDYHKPSDDYDKINSDGEEKVVKYVFDVAMNIIQAESKPDYLAVERKDTGRMSGSRVYVGTVPDFAGDVDGYKLGGVTDGSPAATAGLKAGDIIIKFGEKKISNLYDFTYAIGDFVPGDKVNVVVTRGNEELTFEVELGSR
jgi:hypothetical protein